MRTENKAQIIILMGVAGSGKTTIGLLLKEKLGWEFYDGDDFHPKENIDKMSRGIPLSDEDRMPWLDNIRNLIDQDLSSGNSAIIACSALKESYRQRLKQSDDAVNFVFLKGDFELIQSRMNTRKGHYMKPAMLKSQFDALEMPLLADDTHIVSIDNPLEEIVKMIISKI